METKYSLKLTFMSNVDETISITIPKANSAIQPSAVESGMQMLIDLGIVAADNGTPVAIKGAELIKTETETFQIS